MASNQYALVQSFCNAAEKVSAIVSEVKSMDDALDYTIALCRQKEAGRRLISGTGSREVQTRQKIIAAPRLSDQQTDVLAGMCDADGIGFLREGLRDHLAGIDIGLTMADYGIAETGTLVIDSSSEEVRLATMISDVHVMVLPIDLIRPTAFDIERELSDRFKTSPGYYAFITGASRTADIERVLALGVHGPLELQILLLSD